MRRVSVMTLCECRVDRPFPYHVIRCWVRTKTPLPPQHRHCVAYLNPLFGGYPSVPQNDVTWTCDQHDWSSPIIIVITFISPIVIVPLS